VEVLRSGSRDAYERVQIAASSSKMGYCKFSYRDAVQYLAVIRADKNERRDLTDVGPIVALGVRNGREVDCFRIAKRGSLVRQQLVAGLERRWKGFAPRVPWLEAWDRGDAGALDQLDCVGVELNPMVHRPDVWVGSFDQLPDSWTDRFEVAYTNAFDHAFDPEAAAACWRRVVRPGGYLVLCFPTDQDAAPIDPVGHVSLDDVRELFPGELIYYRLRGSAWRYTEHIIRLA
jgi:hypothetical protein